MTRLLTNILSLRMKSLLFDMQILSCDKKISFFKTKLCFPRRKCRFCDGNSALHSDLFA